MATHLPSLDITSDFERQRLYEVAAANFFLLKQLHFLPSSLTVFILFIGVVNTKFMAF